MGTPTAEQIIQRAATKPGDHTAFPTFPEMGSNVPSVIIISCADPRVVPEKILHLEPGEAIVFRNIAGHPQSVINGVLALDVALKIKSIIMLHHTDCGSTYWTDETIKGGLKERYPHNTDIEKMEFGATTTTIQQNLVDDLEWLRGYPLMREDLAKNIRGFLFDIKTGTLIEAEQL